MDYSMGNLLIISGDDREDIKRFIESFLSQDPESDDPNDKCIDFYKIIPVNVPENECERMRQWGVMQNATNTSVIYEEGGKPEAMVNKIYFDTEDTVPKIVKALAEKRPIYIIGMNIAMMKQDMPANLSSRQGMKVRKCMSRAGKIQLYSFTNFGADIMTLY